MSNFFPALAASLLCLALLAWSTTATAIEEPAYQVVLRDGDVELRDYAAYLVAETTVVAGFDDAGNIAFRRLFGYISGDNRGKQKIAMTAPVRQDPADGGGQRVAFIMPRDFTHDSVPLPTDAQVHIRELPPQRLAVLRYSGRWTEGLYREQERRLLEWLSHKGLSVAGASIYARYNAPFVPWPLRHNEVLIPVSAEHGKP